MVLKACFFALLFSGILGFGWANPVGITNTKRDAAPKFSWKDTKYWFSFGDSYTSTSWNISLGITSPDPDETASDGPNWVNYLNSTFNESVIYTRNLAYGGATIDSHYVTPYLPTVISLKGQVLEFLEYFFPVPEQVDWSSDNTLFSVWIGINDVGNSALWTNITQVGFQDLILTEWEGLMNELYAVGARNFLFLNLPALEKAPIFTVQGNNVTELMNTGVLSYNEQLALFTQKLAAQNTDANYYLFDAHSVFETILANGKEYGFKNVTDYCVAYENGTPTETYYNSTCIYPVEEYFWLNSLHPTYPVHKVLAQNIAKYLESV